MRTIGLIIIYPAWWYLGTLVIWGVLYLINLPKVPISIIVAILWIIYTVIFSNKAKNSDEN